jgi:hypothetical protein
MDAPGVNTGARAALSALKESYSSINRTVLGQYRSRDTWCYNNDRGRISIILILDIYSAICYNL